MLLGVVVIFLPFLGFPSFWDNIISVILGLLIIGISYKLIPSVKSSKTQTVTNPVIQKDLSKAVPANDLPFVEHQSDQGSGNVNSAK